MPRFVLLRHECPPGGVPPSHWDLMLEDGDALVTFRLMELPTAEGPAVDAEPLARHRLAYLDFQGPLSGNRGEVRRVDAGEFRWIDRTPERATLELAGEILCGAIVLEAVGDSRFRLTVRGS